MKRILITGSGGFVGYHTVLWLLQMTDWEIIGLDSFRHAGCSPRAVPQHRYNVFCHDLNAPVGEVLSRMIGDVDYILNLASISDVNLSITNPLWVWENNTRLMGNILELAREKKPEMFIQCSTDEVYGPAPDGYFHEEWDRVVPSNPYSASKAAQEALCIAYWRTYGVPVVITNTMNMIGERQESTKYVPMIINAVMSGQELVVHGRPGHVGSRMYLDAKNLADAWLFLMRNLSPLRYDSSLDDQRPSRYNIVGQKEVDNLTLALTIASICGKELFYRLEDFHSSRPGHDRRYALDGGKIRELGWEHPIPLRTTLNRIVDFYRGNHLWLSPKA